MNILEEMDLLQNSTMLKPKVVEDLILYEDKFLGKEKFFLITDERGKYIKLTKNQFEFYKLILPYLDGNFTVEEFQNILAEYSNNTIHADNILQVLYKNNLLEEKREDSKSKVELELSSQKVIEKSLKDFEEKHSKAISILDIFFRLAAVVIIIIALILVCFNGALIKEVYAQTKIFSWSNVKPFDFIFIALFSVLAIPIHELGHLLCAHRLGVKWKSFTFALRWGISPVYYIKYYQFYSNKSKVKIKILLSGIYMNFVQACLFFILLVFTYDWKMAVLAILNLGMVVSCIFPSGTSDGYHVMSMVLDLEGIRWKMIQSVSKVVKNPKEFFTLIKQREQVILFLYFGISYTMGILGSIILLSTIIDYLHIFSADKFIAVIIVFVCGIASLLFNIIRFVSNLKKV